MRKRVYRISEDRFTDVMPEYSLPSSLDLTCLTGEVFSGVLSFSVSEGQTMRGIVYCDNPYVQIEQPAFEGERADITFVVPDIHVKAQDVISGTFTVVAVGLEAEIPFSVTYKDRLPMLSDGTTIDSLEQFASLCQVKFNEAATLFYSDSFGRFVKSIGPREALLYKAYSKAVVSQANVDEFLVSLGLKETMTFDIAKNSDEYYLVTENTRGTVELTRSTWGYIDVEVSCDSDFVTVEREHITSDFFLGSVFAMHYYIHVSKLHPGNNLAKINFDYNGIHKELIVLASTRAKGFTVKHEDRGPVLAVSQLKRLYMDYRFHKITTALWAEESLKILDGYDINQEDVDTALIKALIYITSHRNKEAAWIIMDLKKTIADRHSAQFAMLLYLSALLEPQEDFVNEVTAQVEEIYTRYNDDVMIFWCLCYLREAYVNNPTAKLEDVLNIINRYPSPIIFVEVYDILVTHPYMLSELTPQLIMVLKWCIRKNVITEDMALVIGQAAMALRYYSDDVFDILRAVYRLYPTDTMLLSVVSYLLKNTNSKVTDHEWFVKALESDLKVAGVFEAYVNTMEKNSREPLPKVLLMFFKYNNSLTFDRKALLYADIIERRMEDQDTYIEYRDVMERFTVEMLKAGVIDDNLAVCYGWMMDLGIIDSASAQATENLIFKRRLSTSIADANRAILFNEQYENPTITEFKDGLSYIKLLDESGIVLVEDKRGVLYGGEGVCKLDRIVNFEADIEDVRNMAPDNPGYVLRDIMSRVSEGNLGEISEQSIIIFLNDETVAAEYKRSLYPMIIELMRAMGRGPIVLGHFMRESDYSLLSKEAIDSLIGLAIDCGRFDLAWELTTNQNASELNIEDLHRLCHYKVTSSDRSINDMLLLHCAKCAKSDSISDSMADYLAKYYVGPTDLMMRIYLRAKNVSAEYVEFAERVLIQSLYRGFLLDGSDELFLDYANRKNNKLVLEAYLNFVAHAYIYDEKPGNELVFSHIYDRFRRGRHLGESMRISLLKFLTLYDTPSEENLEVLDDLLGESILRGQYFRFYSSLSYAMQVKYHLYDKYFVEYHGPSGKSIYITYSVNSGTDVKKELTEMYDGVYVRPFTLFFGDTFVYTISDEEGNELSSEQVDFLNMGCEAGESRFALLGEINKGILYDERDDLLRALKRYQGLAVVTDTLFTEI